MVKIYFIPVNPKIVKGKGTEQGLAWFKQQLSEFTFNEVLGGHVDGKIALIKPGLLVTWKKAWIPEKLKSWDCIVTEAGTKFPEDFKQTRKQHFYKNYIEKWLSHWIGYVDETVFDVNMLSLSEDKVICTGADKEVFTQLEKRGVTLYIGSLDTHIFGTVILLFNSRVRRKGTGKLFLMVSKAHKEMIGNTSQSTHNTQTLYCTVAQFDYSDGKVYADAIQKLSMAIYDSTLSEMWQSVAVPLRDGGAKDIQILKLVEYVSKKNQELEIPEDSIFIEIYRVRHSKIRLMQSPTFGT